MPEFFFKIDSKLFSILHEVIEEVTIVLKKELAISIDLPTDDPELAESWKETLLQDLNSDCRNLLFLIGHESFAKEAMDIEPEFAEASSRACSAIRLKLRKTLLENVPDHQLESGDLELNDLPEEIQKPYTCYAFLAALQESLILNTG